MNIICGEEKDHLKNKIMEQQKSLDELHKESMAKAEEYLKAKENLKPEDKEKLHNAKKEWQEAWSKFQEILLALEQLEI
jgi:hypothetical protein